MVEPLLESRNHASLVAMAQASSREERRPLRTLSLGTSPSPEPPSVGLSARLRIGVRHRREPREIGELQRMKRRTRREGKRDLAAPLHEQARTQRHASLALAPARAEARVALERLDVVVPAGDGVLQLVE